MRGSFLPKEKVIVACKATLAQIKQSREQALEDAIAKLMKPRWFFPTRTREQAIAWLEAPDGDHGGLRQIDFIRVMYGYQEESARRVLFAAKAAIEMVFVTAADFEEIKGNYDE